MRYNIANISGTIILVLSLKNNENIDYAKNIFLDEEGTLDYILVSNHTPYENINEFSILLILPFKEDLEDLVDGENFHILMEEMEQQFFSNAIIDDVQGQIHELTDNMQTQVYQPLMSHLNSYYICVDQTKTIFRLCVCAIETFLYTLVFGL
ncbi:hypothetical protein ACJX0J_006613 [Zea mays]